MVDKRVEDVRIQKLLIKQLKAVSNFLKFGFSSHIDKDNDPVYDSRRALVMSKDGGSVDVNDIRNGSNYLDCLKPFQLIDNIRSYVDQENYGVKVVLDDAGNKLNLFMRHCMRFHVQRTVYTEAMHNLLDQPAEEHAVIVMDYKMKFGPRK